ncbi:hypothetical protein ACIRO1_33650 [Streptomyces sp. NPDC102381]|uniref:hypothetical protein n=1 Tax=Streptomyces sp. NPDC102381 TaxID=3366164 RepID=UPI0038066F27
MSSPIGPIRPFQTEDRDEAMGCASGCFIVVFGAVLAFVVGIVVQAAWQMPLLSLVVGVLVLVGGFWLGSRIWPRVERYMPDPYPEDDDDH